MWHVIETSFKPHDIHHQETLFTIGNGYLSSRGTHEEGYTGQINTTFSQGVFDKSPEAFSELVNLPDWIPVEIEIDGERFSMESVQILKYKRVLDLKTGLITRTIQWLTTNDILVQIKFERFASMFHNHLTYSRCTLRTNKSCNLKIVSNINGAITNQGKIHLDFLNPTQEYNYPYIHCKTKQTEIELSVAVKSNTIGGILLSKNRNNSYSSIEESFSIQTEIDQPVIFEKIVAYTTSKDEENVCWNNQNRLAKAPFWNEAYKHHQSAWEKIWEKADVVIEGDDNAQLGIRYSLFQLLIAAPFQDADCSIGAKTLSGFGYFGHVFWDTEIFILPFFTFCFPEIGKHLLNYRYNRLTQARERAKQNGYCGARFPWESADSGYEACPKWVPDYLDSGKMIRMWTGDIEIHISADIAFAAYQYWNTSNDNEWFSKYGCEIILDTASYWLSRMDIIDESGTIGFLDVTGPDEYHDHINNNAYTNAMAKWNILAAIEVHDWLKINYPEIAENLCEKLSINQAKISEWEVLAGRIKKPQRKNGIIEQFDGYFDMRPFDLSTIPDRNASLQHVLGVEGAAATPIIKQPDVLMMQYLLENQFSIDDINRNYCYYSDKTDHEFGSSLGPSIHAILASKIGARDDAYQHFVRAFSADLFDIRGNAGDGIHAASAGGVWLAIVYGFAGIRIEKSQLISQPLLPLHWKRLAFKLSFHGEEIVFDISNECHEIP